MCTISKDKAIKIMEWIFFIGFSIVAGWFASRVLQQFFSQKTSFSQHEEEVTTYPVISLSFLGSKDFEVNLTNVKIKYWAKGMKDYENLQMGETHCLNHEYNKTEKILLENLEDLISGSKAYRIIHVTPILDKKRPIVSLEIYTLFEKKNNLLPDLVGFFLSSQKNSPGFLDNSWIDGEPLQLSMNKNTAVSYNLRPQKTKYVQQMGNCQKESYYECIASHLDVIEFDECSKKCIPNVFSNIGKNYSTTFCQNNTVSQKCIFDHMLKQEIGSNCKNSCSKLEYFGDNLLTMPYQSKEEDKKHWNVYWFKYRLNNLNFSAKVYEEYLIYDTIGMIAAVGGTLGISKEIKSIFKCIVSTFYYRESTSSHSTNFPIQEVLL